MCWLLLVSRIATAIACTSDPSSAALWERIAFNRDPHLVNYGKVQHRDTNRPVNACKAARSLSLVECLHDYS